MVGNVTVGSSPANEILMYDVISSTLNKLVPWTGVERSGDNIYSTRVDPGYTTDTLNNYFSNVIITDVIV